MTEATKQLIEEIEQVIIALEIWSKDARFIGMSVHADNCFRHINRLKVALENLQKEEINAR